jgi:hypothetical protein
VGLSACVWQRNPRLNFGLSVSESTGEILTPKKEAYAGAIRFIITSKPDGSLLCSMMGSLHKHSNADGINWNNFIFTDLSKTLDALHANYGIILKNTHIHTLEIGVNIPLNYAPKRVFKSVICHKGKAFDHIDRRGQYMGVVCEHTDYIIKLYDKGQQAHIMDNTMYLLRYELKLKRQRMLEPYGVRTFADLQSVEKVLPLLCLLIDRLNEIIFFDFTQPTDSMTDTQRLHWERYSNPKYWERLNRKQYYNARKQYAGMIAKYGALDCNKLLGEKVIKKWLELAEISKHKTLGQIPHILKRIESSFSGTFSKLEYLMENVPYEGKKMNTKKQSVFGVKKKRFCVSCGRDISEQKNNSRFCSEKLYGKEARKCRNKDSNRRLALKRKIKRAKEKDLKIKIIFIKKNREKPPNKQAAATLVVTREWLNSVKRVTTVRPRRHKSAKKSIK